MRRGTRNLLIAFLSVGILLAAGEAYFRAQSVEERIKAQYAGKAISYVPDPELGALLAPGQKFDIVTPEFTYTLQTDHAGFPNRDPWPERLDVAVLGNSLITGSGVGYEGQFSTLLRQRLGERSVLNFGIHGGGTRQQLLAYRKYAAPLHPKLVIATLWLVWEIDNTRKFDEWLAQDPRPDFTEYRLTYGEASRRVRRSSEGRWSRAAGFVRGLLGQSHLARKVREWMGDDAAQRSYVEQVRVGDGQTMLLSARNEDRLFSGWVRPGVGDLRDQFFAPLEELRSEVEADGGRLLVVLVPAKEELYASSELPEIFGVVEAARLELARRHFDVLDLYPEFEGVRDGPPPYFLTDMHLNGLGHQIVADAVAAWTGLNRVFADEGPAAAAATASSGPGKGSLQQGGQTLAVQPGLLGEEGP